jgi:hypothetical protein
MDLIHYYKTLLSKTKPNIREAIQKIMRHIPRIVLEEYNDSLLREISLEKVEK